MEIIYKQGDLFKGNEDYIVHGCNAQGKMGSGFAKKLRELYPEAYEKYLAEHNREPLEVGQVVTALTKDNKVVFNAITQQWYGKDKDFVYVDYKALRVCFIAINRMFSPNKLQMVAMPKVGAGLANGDWNIISKIIEDTSTNYQPIVYEG